MRLLNFHKMLILKTLSKFHIENIAPTGDQCTSNRQINYSFFWESSKSVNPDRISLVFPTILCTYTPEYLSLWKEIDINSLTNWEMPNMYDESIEAHACNNDYAPGKTLDIFWNSVGSMTCKQWPCNFYVNGMGFLHVSLSNFIIWPSFGLRLSTDCSQ